MKRVRSSEREVISRWRTGDAVSFPFSSYTSSLLPTSPYLTCTCAMYLSFFPIPSPIPHRIGQLLVTTLSEIDGSSENDIDIYSNTSPPLLPSEHAQYDDIHSNEVNKRRNIVLRNMMLDMILSLLCSNHMELNTKWVVCVCVCVSRFGCVVDWRGMHVLVDVLWVQ